MRSSMMVAICGAALACGGGGGGMNNDCSTKPFGTYAFTSPAPTTCRTGETPGAANFSLTFGTAGADGGTAVSYYNEMCEQRWQGCEVVITCPGGNTDPFDLTFDAAKKTLTGTGAYCACNGTGFGNSAQCTVTGTKP